MHCTTAPYLWFYLPQCQLPMINHDPKILNEKIPSIIHTFYQLHIILNSEVNPYVLCVCDVCACIYVCTGAQATAFAYGGPRLTLGMSSSIALHLTCLRLGLFTERETCCFSWSAIQQAPRTLLYPPILQTPFAGITGVCHHAQLSHACWRSEFGFSCLCNKPLAH